MNCSHNYSICKCWSERSIWECECESVYACICINVCWALVGCNWACSTGHIVTYLAFVTWVAVITAAALRKKSQFWQDALVCCSIHWPYLYSTQYENTTLLMCSNIILRPVRFIQWILLLLLLLLAEPQYNMAIVVFIEQHCSFRSRYIVLYKQCVISSARSFTSSHHSNLLHYWLWGCS